MVLHYLVNVTQPPVLPNLQLYGKAQHSPLLHIDGWDVQFFQDEEYIQEQRQAGTGTTNRESLGSLLRGFFQYFAQAQHLPGYYWKDSVLSLRSQGGILTKQEKEWTGATTEKVEGKEIRSRYLFAIEDPFELSHNVARTVTYPGLDAIRGEFRRAYRILGDVGKGLAPSDGDIYDELIETPRSVADGVQTSLNNKGQTVGIEQQPAKVEQQAVAAAGST